MYKTLVIIHKLVTHDYFMDDMDIADLSIMTKYANYADVSNWNRARHIMLAALTPYLKKKDTTAAELFPLPFDEQYKPKDTSVSNEQVEWFNKYKNNYIKTKKDSN